MATLAQLALPVHDAPSGWSYDMQCCGGMDCHQVADGTVEETSNGIEVKGFGVLSDHDPRVRWSGDEHDHLCINNNAFPPILLCVYRRPKLY